MPLPPGEPDSPEAVTAWIAQQTARQDRFAHVARRSDAHRAQHGCDVFPSHDGPMLGVLAAAAGAQRMLEVGCGLGYSALWLAFGSAPAGTIQTIERDPSHVALAREAIAQEGFDDRVTILEGEAAPTLAALAGPYDLIFVDSDVAEYVTYLDHFGRLLRPCGVLLSSNLFLGQYSPDVPGLETGAAYRRRLVEDDRWFTVFLPNGKAVSVRQ
jgi:predicted O-methyltransferase YrrM